MSKKKKHGYLRYSLRQGDGLSIMIQVEGSMDLVNDFRKALNKFAGKSKMKIFKLAEMMG